MKFYYEGNSNTTTTNTTVDEDKDETPKNSGEDYKNIDEEEAKESHRFESLKKSF